MHLSIYKKGLPINVFRLVGSVPTFISPLLRLLRLMTFLPGCISSPLSSSSPFPKGVQGRDFVHVGWRRGLFPLVYNQPALYIGKGLLPPLLFSFVLRTRTDFDGRHDRGKRDLVNSLRLLLFLRTEGTRRRKKESSSNCRKK